MLEYLNKFPLFGYKYFAQMSIFKVHDLIQRKEHKNEISSQKLNECKRYMKIDGNFEV